MDNKVIKIATSGVITMETIQHPENADTIVSELQAHVGGYVRLARARMLQEPYVMLVDDDGLRKGKHTNGAGSALCGDKIVGDIVLMKNAVNDQGEQDLTPLDDTDAMGLYIALVRLTRFVCEKPIESTKKR